MKAKVVEIKDGQQLGELLGKLFGEGKENPFNKINEEMKEKMKESENTATHCEAVDKLLNALSLSKEEKLRALTLVLRNESSVEEDSLENMLDEYTRDMEVIATISQLFNIKTAEGLIRVMSSASSALAVIGDEAVKRANSGVKLHREESCDCDNCGHEDCDSRKEEELVGTDKIIADILKNLKK